MQGDDARAGGDRVAAERALALQDARDRGGDRIEAHRLVGDGAEIRELLDLARHRSRRRRRDRPPARMRSIVPGFCSAHGERPRQRRRGGLVAADEQRHQVIAQLVVAERAAVVVAGGDEERQDVLPRAALGVGQRAAAGDLVEEDGVDGADAIGDLLHAASATACARRRRRRACGRRGRAENRARARPTASASRRRTTAS